MKHSRRPSDFLIVLCILAAVFLLSGCVSDKMIARAVAKYFDSNEPTVLVDGYERIRAGVSAWVDVPYGDTSKSEILDVYRPMHTDAKLPLIIWVHGGAYIAGSKEQSVPYVVMLADKGFVTATINYQVAPKGKYPLPVEQTAKAYRYLMDNAEAYGIDTDLVFLAGDSAGAQIAAQFLVAQTSLDYAMKAGLPQVVDDPRTLRGALLFCGPYDITKFDSMGENTTLSRVMVSAKVKTVYGGREHHALAGDGGDSPPVSGCEGLEKLGASPLCISHRIRHSRFSSDVPDRWG